MIISIANICLFLAQRGQWGSEERHHLPFQRGVRFTLTISTTGHGFSVSVFFILN